MGDDDREDIKSAKGMVTNTNWPRKQTLMK